MKILYKPSFLRSLKKIPPDLIAEAKEKIILFAENSQHSFLKTHKLKGKLSDKYSFSVNYKYRIVFEYEGKDRVVLLGIGDHDIYK